MTGSMSTSASTTMFRTTSPSDMEQLFNALADELTRLVSGDEIGLARFSAEVSDFVRMNRGRIRQPGTVSQAYLDLDLVRGATHAQHALALTGDLAVDRAALAQAVAGLRSILPDLAPDPHLLLPATTSSSHQVVGGALPPADDIIATVLDGAAGLDLVGLYAGGPVCRGFASTTGQRNWHAATCFNLQWSLYHRADKAVKCAYSGLAWDPATFTAILGNATEDLARMAVPSRSLPPGRYRAYLTPAAMEDIVYLLCWNSFSGRALATRQSPLARMHGPDGQQLDPRINLAETTAESVAPGFQDDGFLRPGRVPLISAGRLTGSLISPRTAREFGDEFGGEFATPNGANASESPESLAMAGGALATREALAALDTGLWIGNLHYLNFSDRNACRMTGMTRFASFWVEGGRIVAPVDVLRFDDTLFRMLGTNLEALTAETEFILDSSTYRRRSLASMHVPGALLSELAFTL